MYLRQSTFVFLIIAVLAGCSPKTDISPTRAYESVSVTGGGTTMTFAYDMPTAEKKIFLKKLTTLRARASYESIIKTFGPPRSEFTIRGKETNAAVRGITLSYYLRIWNGRMSNEKYDQSVTFILDNDKKLTEVCVQNIADISQYILSVPITELQWDDINKSVEQVDIPKRNRIQGEQRGDSSF
jgi:hypothetical protein